MLLDVWNKVRDKVISTVAFVLGPWMRNPEKNMSLFRALAGYALMLTAGGISKSLMAKLITWGILLVWTLLRSFKTTDIVRPVDAAKEKLPELAQYHAGAAVAFLVLSL